MNVIAIVGNGIAGTEAAEAARKTDPHARIIMVTKESYPLYSACVLADYIADRIPRQRVFLRTVEDCARAGIELMIAKPVLDWSPEQHMLYFDDGALRYDRLVLATGSRPFIPPVPGVGKDGFVALKTLRDADLLRTARGKNAVVVGTGPVGIEAGIALHRRGWSVSVVEMLDRVLPRLFDLPLANTLKNRLETRGITIFLNEKVQEILGDTSVEGVLTDRRTLPADVVVWVIGMRPELTLLNKGQLLLGASGGVAVDRHMKTNQEGVWACGDCVESEDLVTGRTGLFMLWHNARLQGRIAGANAAGAGKRYPGSVNITTINIFEEAAASAGTLASEVSSDEIRVLHRKSSWGELYLVLKDTCLVGVQAVGRTERVGGLIGIMLQGKDLRKTLMRASTPADGPGLRTLRNVREDLLHLFG